jgi:hypothetical protein
MTCGEERGLSALGVAEEGADDAFLAAVAVAGLERHVLRPAELARLAPAMRAAAISEVNGKRRATAPDDRDHAAAMARAFVQRLLRAATAEWKSKDSPNAPQAPTASAPAARAVLTVTNIKASVASSRVAATTARMTGVKLSVIPFPTRCVTAR